MPLWVAHGPWGTRAAPEARRLSGSGYLRVELFWRRRAWAVSEGGRQCLQGKGGLVQVGDGLFFTYTLRPPTMEVESCLQVWGLC